VLQHAKVTVPNGVASTLFISAILNIVDAFGQCVISVYAIFCCNEELTRNVSRDVKYMIELILAGNHTVGEYVRERLQAAH
jgi:hypothetical protein